ncbi:hypothetical protein K0M31_020138 [Melipona bicolor]|uniref:Uncharacterized protein n=1 Tax=Melipona bicolor TaxID=60889 RepID=A0AA40G0V7_9HYME|nr:hypothetical protein K0M31_020138 [Melipona bicolor]
MPWNTTGLRECTAPKHETSVANRMSFFLFHAAKHTAQKNELMNSSGLKFHCEASASLDSLKPVCVGFDKSGRALSVNKAEKIPLGPVPIVKLLTIGRCFEKLFSFRCMQPTSQHKGTEEIGSTK